MTCAQLGEKDEPLALLRRHFTVYEQIDAVRAKEMQEARDDVAFAPLKRELAFVPMTSLADRDAASHR